MQMFPIWLVFWGYDTLWLARSPDLTRVIFVVGLSEGRAVWLSTWEPARPEKSNAQRNPVDIPRHARKRWFELQNTRFQKCIGNQGHHLLHVHIKAR